MPLSSNSFLPLLLTLLIVPALCSSSPPSSQYYFQDLNIIGLILVFITLLCSFLSYTLQKQPFLLLDQLQLFFLINVLIYKQDLPTKFYFCASWGFFFPNFVWNYDNNSEQDYYYREYLFKFGGEIVSLSLCILGVFQVAVMVYGLMRVVQRKGGRINGIRTIFEGFKGCWRWVYMGLVHFSTKTLFTYHGNSSASCILISVLFLIFNLLFPIIQCLLKFRSQNALARSSSLSLLPPSQPLPSSSEKYCQLTSWLRLYFITLIITIIPHILTIIFSYVLQLFYFFFILKTRQFVKYQKGNLIMTEIIILFSVGMAYLFVFGWFFEIGVCLTGLVLGVMVMIKRGEMKEEEKERRKRSLVESGDREEVLGIERERRVGIEH